MPIAEAAFSLPNGLAAPGVLLALGPTIQVLVGRLTPAQAAGGQPVAGAAPAGGVGALLVSGLVDTGAAQSCIDSALAARLQLPVVDRIALSGSNGAHQHDVFAAQITVPALGITEAGRFAGVHLTGGQQPHEVLLGRTFLQNVVMIYDGRRSQVMLASGLFGLFGGFQPPNAAVAPVLPSAPPAADATPTADGPPQPAA